MKTTSITTLIAIAFLTAGTASAQSGQGRRGGGYGGPPRTDTERAARQEECQKANDGVCPNGGVCPNDGVCDGQGKGNNRGQGKGQKNGQGKGQRTGPRDGSGPRGGGANCPAGT